MPIKTHLEFTEIKKRLMNLAGRGVSFAAVCYRCTEPQFAGQIVTGLGSQLHGGRWNPKGSFPTAYLCETAEAALQEYLARARRMKLPDYKSLPMVMAAIKIRTGNLLDLTDAKIAAVVNPFLEAEKVHWRTIQNRREAVSQSIGRAAHEICFSGIIAPSQALPRARNIVIFPQKLKDGGITSLPTMKPAH
jgi:RES domain-containing protein